MDDSVHKYVWQNKCTNKNWEKKTQQMISNGRAMRPGIINKATILEKGGEVGHS